MDGIGHRADRSFFDEKRPWSERKDRILGSYITAYLPKIATQRRPILIVDAFAGPGKFKDGKPGSPLILAHRIQEARSRRTPLRVDVRLLAIERDAELAGRLSKLLAGFPFAEARCGDFSEQVAEIARLARTHSVFLYVDPFTVEGLHWEVLDRVFRQAISGTSVEVLLNLNAFSFVRRARAALSMSEPDTDDGTVDTEVIDAEFTDPPSVSRLDDVVGGQWWRGIVQEEQSAPVAVRQLAERLCLALSERFAEVCMHAVFARPHHIVPKYYLVFASRHPQALRLMNDEMVTSRDTLAEQAAPQELLLFETRPFDLVPEMSELPEVVFQHAVSAMTRGDLIMRVIRHNFCTFLSADISKAIGELLKSGRLQSATRRARINDTVMVWRVEPPGR